MTLNSILTKFVSRFVAYDSVAPTVEKIESALKAAESGYMSGKDVGTVKVGDFHCTFEGDFTSTHHRPIYGDFYSVWTVAQNGDVWVAYYNMYEDFDVKYGIYNKTKGDEQGL